MLNIAKVEALIKEKGWSKAFFCKAFDRSRTWIDDWKRGRGLPEGALLEAIADKLGTTVAYLMDESETKKPATDDGSGLRDKAIKFYMAFLDKGVDPEVLTDDDRQAIAAFYKTLRGKKS